MPYISPVPHDRRLSPVVCGQLAAALDETVEKFRWWHFSIPPASRIPQAATQLRSVAESGTFPRDCGALIRIGHAIRDALDFREINRWATEGRQRELAEDINHAMMGASESQNRRPRQFQTQLWWGAILHYGRLAPRALPPTPNRKRADFLIDLAPGEYAVEIKRPESARSLIHEVRRARSQIDASARHGVVLMDVSDCLPEGDLYLMSQSPSGPPQAAIEHRFRAMRDKLGDRIFDRERREVRPGYSSIMLLMLVARGFRWDRTALTDPDSFLASWSGLFTSIKGNLVWHHGQTIRTRIEAGMREARIHIWRTTGDQQT